jgi:Uma2 family endonuclease
LVYALSEELGVKVEAAGSTTLKREKMAKGAEPDESFYVQNAANIVGQLTADTATEPPPDVVVEIDTTNESLDKFKIYAAVGVPELWRYDGEKTYFYQLSGTVYREIQNSVAFPVLAAADLTRFVERSKTEGQTAALAAFRKSLRERK